MSALDKKQPFAYALWRQMDRRIVRFWLWLWALLCLAVLGLLGNAAYDTYELFEMGEQAYASVTGKQEYQLAGDGWQRYAIDYQLVVDGQFVSNENVWGMSRGPVTLPLEQWQPLELGDRVLVRYVASKPRFNDVDGVDWFRYQGLLLLMVAPLMMLLLCLVCLSRIRYSRVLRYY